MKLYNEVVFLCPNLRITNTLVDTAFHKVHYNIYMRKVNSTLLDYSEICDPLSKLIYKIIKSFLSWVRILLEVNTLARGTGRYLMLSL